MADAEEQETEKKPSRGIDLAANLSGSEEPCPVPSAHDKVHEAHYFIHQLLENYHDPHLFRFQLSAFLSASRSITWMLQKELAHRDGFAAWYEPRRQAMRDDPDLRVLNELRVGVVHQQSLVPASTAWVGYCKYGRPRLGYGNFSSPLNSSVGLLLLARRQLANYVHPHRIWIGEELGVQRKWALAQRPDTELVTYCITAWEKVAAVVAEAHAWLNAKYTPEAKCGHNIGRVGMLLESEVFPEVAEAWDHEPTHEVTPREDTLTLLEAPDETADVLHLVHKPLVITGWLSNDSKYGGWAPRYRSMLVQKINGDEVVENTAVFFERQKARVTLLPPSSDAPSEDQSKSQSPGSET